VDSPVPKRISALPSLAKCPGFVALRKATPDSGPGRARDSGSAVGRLIELCHRGYLFEDAMLQVAREAPDEFPMYDETDIRIWGMQYCTDTRNGSESPLGVVIGDRCEAEVTLTLDPAPEDSTGEPVKFVGHIDQVRRGPDGILRVWDVKSGNIGDNPRIEYGLELLYQHAWQLAAYALACTETWDETVLPGGIIRLRGYLCRNKPVVPPSDAKVFFHAPWSLETCREMLATPVYHIAGIRNGAIALNPGDHCLYCPGGGPNLCGDEIARHFQPTK